MCPTHRPSQSPIPVPTPQPTVTRNAPSTGGDGGNNFLSGTFGIVLVVAVIVILGMCMLFVYKMRPDKQAGPRNRGNPNDSMDDTRPWFIDGDQVRDVVCVGGK